MRIIILIIYRLVVDGSNVSGGEKCWIFFHIFPAYDIIIILIFSQHCNYATVLADFFVLLIYGAISSSRCALLLLGGILDV